MQTANRVPSGNKVATSYNRENEFRMPDHTWDSKKQLRDALIGLYKERFKEKQKHEERLDELLELRSEIIRLKRQRTNDLEKINGQQDKIIELYSIVNAGAEFSPLKKAGN